MTRMPGITQMESPNHSSGIVRPPRGIVLHTADGSYDGTIGWQMNPASQVSSYFVTAKDGRVTQMVDLDEKAWTQGSGNTEWIGIENEGHGDLGEALTPQQILAIANIVVWLHRTYGMAVTPTDDPINGHGIGWHGMGASIGWGHPACPGDVIKAQRQAITLTALSILYPPAPTPKVAPMFSPPLNIIGGVAAMGAFPDGKGCIVAGRFGHLYIVGHAYFGQPYGRLFWGSREVANVITTGLPAGAQYGIEATTGEKYFFPTTAL